MRRQKGTEGVMESGLQAAQQQEKDEGYRPVLTDMHPMPNSSM